MKILHYGLSSNSGGIETYLLKVANNINKDDFELSFLDMTSEGVAYKDSFEDLGMKIHKITPRTDSFLKNRRELNKLFKTNKFDILHFHANTLSYISPISIALKYGCKVILHSRSSNAPDSLVTKLLHNVNFKFLDHNNIKKIAVSKEAGEWLFRNEEFKILNNGIEIEKFKFNLDDRNQYRSRININENFLVGHVGAFTYAKNHKQIIKIFYEFKKNNEKSKLLLIGDGDKKKEIIQDIKKLNLEKDVIIIKNTSQIGSYMSAMDAMIFPSHYEGYPNVVLEAQTNGLPIIVSNNITKEVIVSPRYYISNINNTEEWIVNLEKIKQDNINFSLRYDMEKTMRSLKKDVTAEIIKIENLYRSLFSEAIKER
ncbi:glycosyltransferase [Exiguobacterium sp. PHA03]|uniref:glycosyltransferase n=1 Tax=Exiguobacterium sp. PHA03 TaxID=3064895 RepID=UPI0035C13848